MSINWYPGHMAKTRRLMSEDVRRADAVCEIIDARIPKSSRNPDLDAIVANKKRLAVLNRADQADPRATARWKAYFVSQGMSAIEANSQKGGFTADCIAALRRLCEEQIRRNEQKGQIGKPLNTVIVGIPNVGKSSFINRLLGRSAAAAADKPGVTRKNQWFTLERMYNFMDTPGLLWPRIEDDETGYALAFTGTIKDEVLDREDLAVRFIERIREIDINLLVKRYSFTFDPEDCATDILDKMAEARGCRRSGGILDTERMSIMLLDDFRSGKLGRITLELPPAAP